MKVNDHFVSTRRFKLKTVKLLRRPLGGTNFWPIAAALCVLVGLMSAPVITESANFRRSTSLQSQLVPIGILFFQDESGMNAPADLGQKIAKDLQQKLAVNYKDVLPRMLNAGLDPSASAATNVEQVITLGKQHGVKFVVRGGLLPVLRPGVLARLPTMVEVSTPGIALTGILPPGIDVVWKSAIAARPPSTSTCPLPAARYRVRGSKTGFDG